MIVWDDRFSVGIKTVDEQHKGLVRQVNELREAMKRGEGKAKVASLLKFLGEYALDHFAAEERLMTLHKYPKFEEHKKIHEAFKADFGRLAQELSSAAKASLLSIEVERRLSNWLVQHIQGKDKEAAGFLVGAGAH